MTRKKGKRKSRKTTPLASLPEIAPKSSPSSLRRRSSAGDGRARLGLRRSESVEKVWQSGPRALVQYFVHHQDGGGAPGTCQMPSAFGAALRHLAPPSAECPSSRQVSNRSGIWRSPLALGAGLRHLAQSFGICQKRRHLPEAPAFGAAFRHLPEGSGTWRKPSAFVRSSGIWRGPSALGAGLRQMPNPPGKCRTDHS